MLTAAALSAVLAGCGGGGGGSTDSSHGVMTINGCSLNPSTSCVNADLSDKDLSGIDLSNSDFTGADMSEADLSDTNLSGANLTEASLKGAKIIDTNLDNANLTKTNLTDATIDKTDLSGATLCGTIRTDGTTDDTDCPPSGGTTTTATTTSTTTTPKKPFPLIVTFTGPTVVSCVGTETKTVVYTYKTKYTTSVEPEVDGQPPGAQAGYDPAGGKMRFPYECPGPHKVSIFAQNDVGHATASAQIVPSSGG